MKRKGGLLLAAACLLSPVGWALEAGAGPAAEPAAVPPAATGEHAGRVAVLPFYAENPEWDAVADALRTRLFARMKARGLAAASADEIDAKLAQLPEDATAPWAMVEPLAFAALLDVDAVVTGALRRFEEHAQGEVTETVVDLACTMISTRDGSILWQVSSPAPLLGNLLPNVAPVDGLSVDEIRARKAREAAELLVDRLEQTIPQLGVDPRRLTYVPEVGTIIVSHFALRGIDPDRQMVQVSLRGSPRCKASFDLLHAGSLEPYKRGLPLHESVPGSYGGSYVITPGDPLDQEFQVIGRITTQSGITRTKKSLTRFKMGYEQ